MDSVWTAVNRGLRRLCRRVRRRWLARNAPLPRRAILLWGATLFANAAFLPAPTQARSHGDGQSAAQAAADAALMAQLGAHIETLASDDFAGRQPGTEGEAKTLRYIARQFYDIGLVSGTNDPGHPWFAPVTVLSRVPDASVIWFRRGARVLGIPPDDMLVLTSGRRALVQGAPLYFVGRDTAAVPPRTELAGRVAVLLDRRSAGVAAPAMAPLTAPTTVVASASASASPSTSPAGAGIATGGSAVTGGLPPLDSGRQNALLAAGASAVITILDGDRTMAMVAAPRKRPGYALASEAIGGDLEAFVTASAMDRVLASGGGSLAALEREADRPDFAPRMLDLATSMEATTRETVIHTHNVIARLPGRHPEAGAVLLTAHWDHFGTCAVAPAPHLICNGAIDNASGVAALIEIARRLARPTTLMPGPGNAPGAAVAGVATPPVLDRDVYLVATTAEELGLLGAEAFAENPPLPLKNIVAAFNLDCVAIAPVGSAVGVVGGGMTPLDAGIAEVAREQHVRLNTTPWPNDYIRRQDGWALLAHDIPAVMATTAYGDPAPLQHFFDTDYHRPGDIWKPGINLGGAVTDVSFNVALVRWFADLRHGVPVETIAAHPAG